MLLTVKNLKKHYATQKAVDDISFSIAKGSIYGLLGPNGAGKSTLLRMITGIFYADEGEILFEGEPLNAQSHIREIGYMPEERGLYKKMKIGEQAMYLAQLRGLSKAEAKEKCRYWFQRLNMESWINKNVEDLSKGMGQKLQFVTTVVHDPKLLILDEPFSGLDPVNANLLKDEIFRLAQGGTTIIFSTHRMEQVEEICDNIALINLGKLMLNGEVKAIKEQFKQHHYVIKLSNPEMQLPSFIESIDRKDNSIQFSIHEGHNVNEVLSYYIQQQNTILAFEEILPSLNDIFIELVQGAPSARAFSN